MELKTPEDAQDNKPPTKAGALIRGVRTEDVDKEGAEEYVVAPYTEGRFGANDKYYVLAKGSIDDNETVLDAAIREAGEETGIDIARLLGPKNIDKLKRGEAVQDCESGYKGVRIKHVSPDVLDFTYNSRERSCHRAVMLNIEVEGIENLHPHLKNQDNLSKIGQIAQVTHPIRTLTSDTDKYPTFDLMLEWLRTMKMPQAPWAKPKIGTPLAPKADANGDMPSWFKPAMEPDYFKKLEAEYVDKTGKLITDAPSWQNFLNWLNATNYSTIRNLTEVIKSEIKDRRVLKGGDKAIIKFDTKDLPLHFYQEGADLLTKEQYLESCIVNAAERGDFARSFAGDTRAMVNEKAPRMQRILASQMAGVVVAAGEESIDKVIKNLKEKPPKTRDGLLWGQPINEPDALDALGADLHEVYRIMANTLNTRPLTEVANLDNKGRVVQAPERGHAQGAA